jgi:hypothetical protein
MASKTATSSQGQQVDRWPGSGSIMIVCAFIKTHTVRTGSSTPSFIIMIQTEIIDQARLRICVEISERFGGRIEAGFCMPVSTSKITQVGNQYIPCWALFATDPGNGEAGPQTFFTLVSSSRRFSSLIIRSECCPWVAKRSLISSCSRQSSSLVATGNCDSIAS